eukprot:6932983-Lingulodinium_polyedra.AAC.1
MGFVFIRRLHLYFILASRGRGRVVAGVQSLYALAAGELSRCVLGVEVVCRASFHGSRGAKHGLGLS